MYAFVFGMHLFICYYSTVEGAIDPFMMKSPVELMLERHEKKEAVDTMFGFNSNVSAGMLINALVLFTTTASTKTITFLGSNLFRSVVHSKSIVAVTN